MSATPAAIAFIRDQSTNQLLLVRRRDYPVWVLPGGGIDPGETPEAAVVREVSEETGLSVTIIRKVAEYSPSNFLTGETHLFECAVDGGEIKTGEESEAIDFFSPGTLPRTTFILHRYWIADSLREEANTIVRPITEVTLWKGFLYLLSHPLMSLKWLYSLIAKRLNKL